MKILTDYMGEVEYTEDEIIKMPKSFYGFPESKRFILIGELTVEFPFIWLQSLDEEELCFILTNPFLFVEEYNFEIEDDILANLGIKDIKDVVVYTTVVVKENLSDSTINLKAPIILNRNTRLAEQVVLDQDLPYKHKIFTKKVEEKC